MIHLNKKQQSLTYLALIDAWDVNVDKLNNQDAVRRNAVAELFAYHHGVAHIVQHAAQILRRSYARQVKEHKYTEVNFDELSEKLGSQYLARLTLGVAGFWAKFDDRNRLIEYSDSEYPGSFTNMLDLPAQLEKLRITDIT